MSALVAFFVRNRALAGMFAALIALLGLRALIVTPRAEDPPYDAPNFAIVAALPGASPTEVESLVLEPLEQHLSPLDRLAHLRSTAADGVALLEIEFETSASADDRHAALLRATDEARPALPADLASLEVRPLRPTEVNVLLYAVVSETAPMREIERLAEEIVDTAEEIVGVQRAKIYALPERKIAVDLEIEALIAASLPLESVSSALSAASARTPGGRVTWSGRSLSVTSKTALSSPEDVESTPISANDRKILRLGDISRVEERYSTPTHLARLDGQRAVWVGVTLRPGANLFSTRGAVSEAVQALPPREEIEVVAAFDQSEGVVRRLSGLQRDFGLAMLLVLFTLLPLGLRASLLALASIPLSIAAALSALHALGYTLDQVSITGLVLSLGLVVDDAIVVIENVTRHLRLTRSPLDAAILGASEIAPAVVGCTATLVLAFVPLLFLPGNAGVYIESLPMSVVLSVLASLVVSLIVIPALASVSLAQGSGEGRAARALASLLERSYGRALSISLDRPVRTLALAALFSAGSLALLPLVGFSLFPTAGIPMFRVEIDAGEGTSLQTTDTIARKVEATLKTRPEVEMVLTNVGAGSPRVYYNVFPEPERTSYAEILVRTKRAEISDLLRALDTELSGIPGAQIRISEYRNGPRVKAPVSVDLSGDDLAALAQASALVRDALAEIDGLVGIDDPLAEPRTDLVVDVDRDRAAILGVRVASIARVVRFGVDGLRLGTIHAPDGETLPLVLHRYGDPPDLAALRSLPVARADGTTLPLAAVADVRLESGPARVTREDGQRSASVTADVARHANTAALEGEVVRALADLPLPRGVRAKLGGEAESREESLGGLGSAALIALFGIAAVLVLEFGSLRAVLTVATVLPLGAAGAVWGLLLSGYTLSFTATVGLVALAGIEIKSSLLLVDRASQLRRAGLPLREAAARAGEQRFLPIVLTSATALGGLLPLALEGSSLYSPLAVVLVGGIVSSTLLARLVTPAAYVLLCR